MNFNKFKERYENIQVAEYYNSAPQNIMVSVCIVTFEHVQYIKQCLDSILEQVCDFNFEILLSEDASKDGTREICLDYAKRFPNKIRLFLHHRENNINIDGNPTGRYNFLYNFYMAKGKYVALCEGDDYWTDPYKLQKQFDFMEENLDCSICYHPSEVIFENSNKENAIAKPKFSLGKDGCTFSIKDLLTESLGMWTASLFFRNIVHNDLPDWFANVTYGDVALKLIAASKGNIGYLGGKPMCVYRRGVIGAWSSDEGKTLAWQNKRLADHFDVLDKFNEYSNYKNNSEIQLKKKKKYISFISAVRPYYSKSGWLKLFLKADLFLISKGILRKILDR